jgi:hypothetical protein
MLRFALSLIASSVFSLAGYSVMGTAATAPTPHLKVIATVCAHAHRARAVSATNGDADTATTLL